MHFAFCNFQFDYLLESVRRQREKNNNEIYMKCFQIECHCNESRHDIKSWICDIVDAGALSKSLKKRPLFNSVTKSCENKLLMNVLKIESDCSGPMLLGRAQKKKRRVYLCFILSRNGSLAFDVDVDLFSRKSKLKLNIRASAIPGIPHATFHNWFSCFSLFLLFSHLPKVQQYRIDRNRK